MYEIEVMYANRSTELFKNVENYEAICDGRLIRITQTDTDVKTMIPSVQIIRIGRKRN